MSYSIVPTDNCVFLTCKGDMPLAEMTRVWREVQDVLAGMKKNRVSCMTNPVREDQCVFVTYKGEAPVNEMMSTRYFANRYLALKHWNRIVVDITELRSRSTFLELISLASDLSSESPSDTRVALVIRPDQVEQAKLVERVARIERVPVAYSFEPHEAKNWVEGRNPLEQKNNGTIPK